jgi:translocation and assembly module TamA
MRVKVLALVLACGLGDSAYAAAPEVIIDPGGVPPAALQSITGAVNAITRLAEDQDGGELSRLRRRARDATLSALETQGYFSPKVTLEAGQDLGGETWDITIVPNARAKVDTVDLAFTGKIAQPEFSDRVAALKAAWPLKPGETFINDTWGKAKSDLIDNVSAHDFFLAKLVTSQATITAETAKADLEVAIDSGPRVRLGEMTTTGLKRVPQELIDRYIRYTPGDAYNRQQLEDWQQALQSTSFFRGTFVTVDDDVSKGKTLADGDLELPLRVRVSEAPARRFSTSFGIDSDNGPRVEALYRQNVVFGKPIWTEAGVGVDKNQQRAFYDVHFAPTLSGYKDSVGVLFNHSDIEGVENSRTGLGWTRKQERKAAGNSRVDYETQTAVVAAYDKTHISGYDEYQVPTLVGTWQWLRRDVNDKYDPREGNLIDFGLGAGITLDKGEPFYRSSLRAQKWWTVGRRDVVTMRGEVGKVWSKTSRLPDDFGYRTGGARTIRGYEYDSIGLKRGDATIGAPALAVASIEYMHYFNEQFGMDAFVDVGDAAASFGQMEPALGYGVGALVHTPAGPFFVDVAYGQRDRSLRLHFSLGVAF